MFLVMLRFSTHRDRAGAFLEAHQAWIRRGFDDGVFLMAGSLVPGLGGAVLAHRVNASELRRRIDDDPFVAEQVVNAEIIEIDPAMTDPRLDFLRQQATVGQAS